MGGGLKKKMEKRKKHSTTKYENAVASLYLEVVKGNDYNEMLYTMNDKETWSFGGDYQQVSETIEPEYYFRMEGQWGRERDRLAAVIGEITFDKDIGWYFNEGVDGDRCLTGTQIILKCMR